MCGIAGIIGISAAESGSLIDEMTERMKHRGPDAGATFVSDGIALGHRRLSIIDLSTNANQPFFDISKRYIIVFNGEIYNYQEIKELLNYSWQTTSDTEVILAAYLQWGEHCLEKLNGMFAFAIWDNLKKDLFVARDRMGVKPFYYYQSNELFVFASEIRSILASGLVPKKLDINSLSSFLANLAVRTPNTIIEGIQQLQPGEYGFYKDNTFKKYKYWSITNNLINLQNYNLSYTETVQKTRHLFEEAIKSRMVADVPVGAFLSGGIDSSAIVAIMAQLSRRSIETFSITFKDKVFDESKYARYIAQQYQTNHTELLLEPNDLLKNLPEYISSMDSPTVDGINTYTISKLVAKTGIKVALSGLGGDELFAGYPGFTRWKKISDYSKLLNSGISKATIKTLNHFNHTRAMTKIASLSKQSDFSFQAFYDNNRANFLSEEIKSLLKNYPDNNSLKNGNWINLEDHIIKDIQTYSQYSIGELTHYTLDVLLKDTDQMSMAWALEIREPFFDYRLIEFLLTVPNKFKYSAYTPKKLLVDALANLIPKANIFRPKQGFSFPWDSWFRNELKEYCNSSIQRLKTTNLFNNTILQKCWNDFLKNDKRINWVNIWTLVVLEKWLIENEI